MSNKEHLQELFNEVKTRLPSFESLPIPSELDKDAVAVIRITSGDQKGASIMLQSIVLDGDMMNVDYSAVKEDGTKLPNSEAQPLVADLVNFFIAKAAIGELTGE